MPKIEEGASIELGTIHKTTDGDDEVKGSENPMRSLRIETFAKKNTSEAASTAGDGVPKGVC